MKSKIYLSQARRSSSLRGRRVHSRNYYREPKTLPTRSPSYRSLPWMQYFKKHDDMGDVKKLPGYVSIKKGNEEILSIQLNDATGSAITQNVKIIFCNKMYNKEWLEDKAQSNAIQYRIIHAIIEGIAKNNGGAIVVREIIDLEVEKYIQSRKLKITPSGGQELKGTAAGIYHAKYAPSKSVAVIWSTIKDVTYVTFDDHKLVKYYRAIHSFHLLRFGKPVYPMNPGCSRKVLNKLESDTPWLYKGIDLRRKYYLS